MKMLAALSAMGMMSAIPLAAPAQAQLSINLSVNFAPPALPVYVQPPIPGPNYLWVPGYWAWDDGVQDYYWVPGTWVMAPRPGLLWTPAWWGWENGAYLFHAGYWGPHVGFYGGVNYGFGYGGVGFQGAYWNGPHVFYNRSVTNVTNVNMTNVYNKTVIVNHVTNVSYNGGPGGVQARPSPGEMQAMHEAHVAPTPQQQQHLQAARNDRRLFASANHGRPPVAAAPHAGQLGGPGVVPARQAAPYHPPQDRQGPGGNGPHAPGTPPRHGMPQDPGRAGGHDGAMANPDDRPGQPARPYPDQPDARRAPDGMQDIADRPHNDAAHPPRPHPDANGFGGSGQPGGGQPGGGQPGGGQFGGDRFGGGQGVRVDRGAPSRPAPAPHMGQPPHMPAPRPQPHPQQPHPQPHPHPQGGGHPPHGDEPHHEH